MGGGGCSGPNWTKAIFLKPFPNVISIADMSVGNYLGVVCSVGPSGEAPTSWESHDFLVFVSPLLL